MSRPLLLRVNGVEKRYPPAAAQPGRFRAFWQLLTRGRAEGVPQASAAVTIVGIVIRAISVKWSKIRRT